ncbi:tetratricopeptide repeat protein [Desulfonema ishimotonii]|uniref:tetratricopeptide repeat protein n=1 Tax=Desulfonema ishimotonii TaxID=45657 RepID=UPI0022B1C21E|nr:tetratricopeptide repeat protein [Desulfonema ishimotonii]
MNKGFLYILVNPSLPGNLLKIGKTARAPKRASEDHPPADVPYVAFDIAVSDCDKAQAVVLSLLKDFRDSEYKDHFRLPLEQAIVKVRTVAEHIDKTDYYKKAIQIDSENPSFYNNLGCSYDKLGNHTGAIDAYKQAIQLDPGNAVFHDNLGCNYGKLGLYRKAIDAFQKAVTLRPDFIKAYFDLGYSYGQLGFHKKAVDAFQKAIEVNPGIAQLYYNLGHSYCRLDRRKDAIKVFREAVRINPNYIQAHYSLGINYLNVNDRDGALRQYRLLKKKDIKRARHLFNLIYRRYRSKMTGEISI